MHDCGYTGIGHGRIRKPIVINYICEQQATPTGHQITQKSEKNRPEKRCFMKRLILGASLLFSALAIGQQQGQGPYGTAPYALDKNPAAQMPPDTKAPPPQELSP